MKTVALGVLLLIGCMPVERDSYNAPDANINDEMSNQFIDFDAPYHYEDRSSLKINLVDSVPEYYIFIDIRLKESHKDDIFLALNEWSDKTNKTFKYNVQFVELNPTDKNQSPHTIKLFSIAPSNNDLDGWTGGDGIPFASRIEIIPELDSNSYSLILMHEMGHAFDLLFDGNAHYYGPYKSIMHESVMATNSSQIFCPEITEFCKLYSCNISCVNEL